MSIKDTQIYVCDLCGTSITATVSGKVQSEAVTNWGQAKIFLPKFEDEELLLCPDCIQEFHRKLGDLLNEMVDE